MTGQANGYCRRCLRPVIWARTEAHNKPLPLDPEPDEAGNQAVFREGEAWRARQLSGDDRPYSFETRYMPHVATCKPPEPAVVTPLRPPVLPQNVIPISAARSLRSGKSSRRK